MRWIPSSMSSRMWMGCGLPGTTEDITSTVSVLEESPVLEEKGKTESPAGERARAEGCGVGPCTLLPVKNNRPEKTRATGRGQSKAPVRDVWTTRLQAGRRMSCHLRTA